MAPILLENQTNSVSFTYPHSLLPTMFASPRGLPYSSLERIAMPFSNIVWLCILIAIVSVVNYLHLCRRFHQMTDIRVNNWCLSVVFEAINSTLGGSISVKTLGVFNRSGLTVWLLATVILRQIYSASLFELLQAQINERPVDTIDSLIKSNYEIYCTPSTCQHIHQNIPKLRER